MNRTQNVKEILRHTCADVCPCNAISLVDNKSKVNPKMCTLCGACVKGCPQKIVKIKRTDMKLNNIRSKTWNKVLGSLIDIFESRSTIIPNFCFYLLLYQKF